MSKIIKRWRMNCFNELLPLMYVIAGGWVFGVILVFVMYHFTNGFTTEDCVTLGSVIAMVIVVAAAFFGGLFTLGSHFALEISMGNTRKEFFISFIIQRIFTIAILLIMVGGLTGAEELIQKYILKVPSAFHSFSVLMDLRFLAAVLFAFPLFSMFLGVMYLKFQKKAFWVMWAIWMFSFMGLPVILNNEAHIITRGITKIMEFVIKVPMFLQTTAILVFAVIFAVVNRLLLQKEKV